MNSTAVIWSLAVALAWGSAALAQAPTGPRPTSPAEPPSAEDAVYDLALGACFEQAIYPPAPVAAHIDPNAVGRPLPKNSPWWYLSAPVEIPTRNGSVVYNYDPKKLRCLIKATGVDAAAMFDRMDTAFRFLPSRVGEPKHWTMDDGQQARLTTYLLPLGDEYQRPFYVLHQFGPSRVMIELTMELATRPDEPNAAIMSLHRLTPPKPATSAPKN